jgi:hypothetical protein
MDIKKWINNSHGLELYLGNTEGKRGNENGILFLVEAFLLLHLKNKLNYEHIEIFKTIVSNLSSYSSETTQIPGLYDRGSKESLNPSKLDIRLISHDNLTAISSFSKKFDLSFSKDIATHAILHQFRFDNAQPMDERFFFKNKDGQLSTSLQIHPRDIFFWLYIGGFSALTILMWPIFFISQVLACSSPKEETSGKLLAFVRLESTYKSSLLLRFTRWICYKKLKNMYGKTWLNELMTIYFTNPDHPCRTLSEGIEL